MMRLVRAALALSVVMAGVPAVGQESNEGQPLIPTPGRALFAERVLGLLPQPLRQTGCRIHRDLYRGAFGERDQGQFEPLRDAWARAHTPPLKEMVRWHLTSAGG